MRLAFFLAALSPRPAMACTVCFGVGNAGDLARGLTLGLLVLLVATFSLLATLVAAIWRMEKRRALAEQNSQGGAAV